MKKPHAPEKPLCRRTSAKHKRHLPTEDELAAELKRELLAIEEGRAG